MESTPTVNVTNNSSTTIEEKTVFSLLSKLNNKPTDGSSKSRHQTDQGVGEDVLILRVDSKNNQSTNRLNKSAYLKLHKSSTSNAFIDNIKGKFEKPEIHVDSDKNQRALKTQSQIIPSRVTLNERRSLILPDDRIRKANIKEQIENLSIDEEYVTIIPRSESEESVSKIKKELAAFTMEQNKKPKGFRKLFSVFSNKDKKKNSDEKTKQHCRKVNDNFHIESNNINRQALHRHTTGSGPSARRPIERNMRVQRSDSVGKVPTNCDEQQMEVRANHFNKTKQCLENQEMYSNLPRKPYVPINNSNLRIESTNPNVSYINLPNVKKFIDTSSSASPSTSDKSNLYQNDAHVNPFPNRIFDNSKRDTPPRLLETKQDVRLVNPKGFVPSGAPERSPINLCVADNYANAINSLEALNITGTVDNFNQQSDIVTNKNVLRNQVNPPSSPSLEASKLKLPPNRDLTPLSPRVRSPIPSDSISTEKIIATELLKGNKSPTPTKTTSNDTVTNPYHKLEKEYDYVISSNQLMPNNINQPSTKPPPVPLMQKYSSLQSQNNYETYGSTCKLGNEESIYNSPFGTRQYFPLNSSDRITTNAVVHVNSPVNRTPTPSNSIQNLTFSSAKQSVRPSTPSDSRIPESPSTTPQKQDIRRSVEAYYWKEIKKMKDKENYNLYMLQLQYGNLFPHLYAAESVNNIRRSRSLSPQTSRNGRRSLSLPRDIRSQQPNPIYHTNAIPENHAVNHGAHPISVQQLQYQQQQRYFNRNIPERYTIDGATMRSNRNTSRPIFKRGSLSSPPQSTAVDDSLKRKVSFSGPNDHNQFIYDLSKKNPSERQIEIQKNIDNDEVFLSNSEYRQLCLSNLRTNSSKEDIYNKGSYPISQKIYTGKPYQNQNALYGSRTQFGTPESIYGRAPANYAHNYIDDGLYRQPVDAIQSQALSRLTRHGSIQGHEELRRQETNIGNEKINNLARRNMTRAPIVSNYPNYNWSLSKQLPDKRPPFLRREIILQDEIYGQFGGYIDNVEKSPAIQKPPNSRQVSVSNKVCDIYGQIHDADTSSVHQTGVIMGQLNGANNNNYRINSQQQFQRNSRLTASANDMNRRLYLPGYSDNVYGRIEANQKRYPSQAPDRPLPAIPQTVSAIKRSDMISDTESGSETTTSEMQLIINNKGKFNTRPNSSNMLVK